MSLSMGTLVVTLLIGVGLAALGLKAYQQNLVILGALRSGRRNIYSMLWHALRVWSPMLFVIVLLLGVASAMAWGAAELVYRYSTIDEFCEVEGLDPPRNIACTGMGGDLAASQIRPLSPSLDIERQLSRRYSEARKRVIATSEAELYQQANNPADFLKGLSAASVLALPKSLEEDPALQSLITQRRRLLQSPIPAPRDIVEIMGYGQSVENRNQTLRDIKIKIQARRKTLYEAEYRQLPQNQKAQYVRKTGVIFKLRQMQVKLDPAMVVLLSGPADASKSVPIDFIRKAAVRALASDEARVMDILESQLRTAEQSAMVYEMLAMVPECTVSEENSTLRIISADFEAGQADPESMTSINAGSFPCPSALDSDKTYKLVSVGFRKSLLLSIDRMRDETEFEAFKKLSTLEQEANAGAVDAKSAARTLGNIVPAVISLGRQECHLFRPFNCVMNGLADSVEAAYTRSRNKMVEKYNDTSGLKVDTASMTIQQQIDHARITTDGEVAMLHAAGYKTAKRFFSMNDVLRLFGWLALFLIAARSFLYVFALEVFDREGESRISFDTNNSVVGNVVMGSEVTIDRNYPVPIFNRGSLTNTLADIEFAPWRWSAPLVRILHGRYFLFNRSIFSPPGQTSGSEQVRGMEVSAKSGYTIIEWQMQPGEEVVFDYRHFYGASANVQLKTDFSLRLSTLLLGKIFFHYARCIEGEGRLLLESRVHNTTQGGMSSIKPARLVAWNRHAQFSAGSHHRPWKTFINPFTIVRESTPGVPNAWVIIAPEIESSGIVGMGLRSIKRVFSRIF